MDFQGSILAMAGKDCVAIAYDHLQVRFRNEMLTNDFEYVRVFGDNVFVGLSGLVTDVETVFDILKFRSKMYNLREERLMSAPTLGSVLQSFLYSKRFGGYYVRPLVAGLDEKGEPYLLTTDGIGAGEPLKDFAAQGNALEEMIGGSEAMWRPDMEPEELFTTISQVFLAACDRQCEAGQGATVHLLTRGEIVTRSVSVTWIG
jgi:20S proteasome subunit beta 3